jgi:NADH:ubiquinone oxidoreductase subunit K
MTPVQLSLYTAAVLFVLGLVILATRQNLIMMLIGLELMLNAANLNLVAFGRLQGNSGDSLMFALFVILVAVCEAAVGIAIVLRVYHFYKSSDPGDISELKERF